MNGIYGLFNTPIITNHGMIVGLCVDGTFKMQPSPVINVTCFVPQFVQYQQYPQHPQNIKDDKMSFNDYFKLQEQRNEETRRIIQSQNGGNYR